MIIKICALNLHFPVRTSCVFSHINKMPKATKRKASSKEIPAKQKKTSGTSNKKTKRANESRFSAEFYNVPSGKLAEKLLGKLLVRKLDDGTVLKGRIVETECYPGGKDKGSATHNGRRTPATEPLYMDPGTTLVYMTYGIYHCMNVSSSEPGGGTFIRALEPVEGIDRMREFRLEKIKSAKDIREQDLCSGPSKLCTSLKIEKATCNKLDLITSEMLWIERDDSFKEEIKIVRTSRIGINSAGKEWASKPYRFYILGNINVSKTDKVKEEELLD